MTWRRMCCHVRLILLVCMGRSDSRKWYIEGPGQRLCHQRLSRPRRATTRSAEPTSPSTTQTDIIKTLLFSNMTSSFAFPLPFGSAGSEDSSSLGIPARQLSSKLRSLPRPVFRCRSALLNKACSEEEKYPRPRAIGSTHS